MQTDFLNIALGFLEGFALIISPCILPILPIILAGSLDGSKKRPFGIILGFVIVFALFTFFSRTLVRYSGIDLNLIRYISYVLLFLLGVVMLSTRLTEKFSRLTQRLANVGSSASAVNNPQGGFLSGILFGGLIAIIWTPCAGPILAAVIVQTVLQQTTWMSFFVVFAFGLGAAVPMLIIVVFGRTILTHFSFFRTHTSLLRKCLGIIVIASVVYMLYQEGGAATTFAANSTNLSSKTLQNELSQPYPAPPMSGIAAWINSPPLQLKELKGKVILIDFWTYSCINCVRTLPYLKEWYNKYHDQGLVIIGVHSPEFDFEKDLNNVKNAVAKQEIKYPVALDNQFVTWRNYHNQYWPAHYLIDKTGNVVYEHFGEGEYDVTENNIRVLLGMNVINAAPVIPQFNFLATQITPETYLGSARADYYFRPAAITMNQTAHYDFPKILAKNAWGLQGDWKVMPDKIISTAANASLKINFYARKVFIVMGNATPIPIHVKLLLNDKDITAGQGKDVKNSGVTVNQYTLFELIALDQPESGILQVTADAPGLEMYAFTFG